MGGIPRIVQAGKVMRKKGSLDGVVEVYLLRFIRISIEVLNVKIYLS